MSKIRSSYFLSENSLRYIDEYKEIYINSVNASFCDDETKKMLLAI